MRRRDVLWKPLDLFIFICLLTDPVYGIVGRHDVDVQQYDALANQFPSAGYWSFVDIFEPQLLATGSACSAVLVSPTKVLTAAHCLSDKIDAVAVDGSIDSETAALAFFEFGELRDSTFELNVASINVHPQWQAENAEHDLAILTLTAPVTNVTPATISIQSPEGLLGTFVGYGLQGNGRDGVGAKWKLDDLGEGLTIDFSDSQFGKRAGHNRLHLSKPTDVPFLTELHDSFVGYDFDSPSGEHYNHFPDDLTDLESVQFFGDSGGPVFAQFPDGDHLVAITSEGDLPPHLYPNVLLNPEAYDPETLIETISKIDVNDLLGPYGLVGGAVWLGLEENRSFLAEHDIAAVPEPGKLTTIALLGLWISFWGFCTRRKQPIRSSSTYNRLDE